MSLTLTVAVCTYNRSDLLAYCLDSLRNQGGIGRWQLLVIDNNSKDATTPLTEKFLTENPEISGRCILETAQGLSHARNRAFRETTTEWILYLDDDAKAETNFISRALEHCDSGKFKILGGVYYPWYHYGQPRWFQDRYGSNALPRYKELSVPAKGYIATGGVMLWDRALLISLGGFDTKVGMVGDKIAYGEETYLQALARHQGYEIAYDPKLIIHHIVMERKLNVGWFFESYFAAGRDAVVGGQVPHGVASALKQLLIGWLVMAKDFILATPKLLKSNYYLENWLIDVFRKMAKRIGSAYTALLAQRP